MCLANLGQYFSRCSLEPLCNNNVLTTVFCKSTKPPMQESTLENSSIAIMLLKKVDPEPPNSIGISIPSSYQQFALTFHFNT